MWASIVLVSGGRMKRIKQVLLDESGQGATEYILLLVVIVALVVLFKDKFRDTIQTKLDELATLIKTFTGT